MRIQKITFIIWLMLACLLSTDGFAVTKKLPLAVDRAFEFTATFNGPRQVIAEWRIAPGYYLYAKRLHISLESTNAYDVRIPQGNFIDDKDRGRYEVLSGIVSVPILLRDKQSKLQLNVDYQGCSKDGFCYPPVHKTMLLDTLTLSAILTSESNLLTESTTIDKPHTSLHLLLTNQNDVQSLLASQHLWMLMLIFLCLGLLLAFTPCVLPMIPILASIIAGQKSVLNTRKACLLSCTYVFGTAITYSLAGMAAALLGSSLQIWLQKPWIIAIISSLFVLLAFSLFGLFELRMPRHLQQSINLLSHRQRGGSYFGAFMMGILSTLIVSPCVTAPLVGVLMYIGQTGSLLLGATLLFIMAIGMGIPLILIGMSAGKWLPRSGPWMNAIKKSFGILMLGMAIWLLSRVIAPTVVMMFWGLFLIIIALFLGVYLPTLIGKHNLNRGLGFLSGCFGLMIILGGINFPSMSRSAQTRPPATEMFTVVHNLTDLNQQLAVARGSKKPVILDFYADWCESCIAMDKHVFNTPEVKQTLNDFVLLRADLTENSAADEALLKKYSVIAPPTVLFFDAKGQEINKGRIVGEIDAKEFLNRLNVTEVVKQCNKEKNINC